MIEASPAGDEDEASKRRKLIQEAMEMDKDDDDEDEDMDKGGKGSDKGEDKDADERFVVCVPVIFKTDCL